MMTTALTVPALFGYGTRQAYALCTGPTDNTVCSGNLTTTQSVSGNNASIRMDTGATVTMVAGNAISITGTGDLSFTNTDGGAISGSLNGLFISASGGGADTVTVTTTQAVSGGQRGIFASNAGTGALTIDAASVSGTNGEGISAQITNVLATGKLSIKASGSVSSSGNPSGLVALQNGTGELDVDVASVAGGGFSDGMFVRSSNANAGAMSITASGAVSGGVRGMSALQYGVGGLTINAASVTGATSDGVRADIRNASSTAGLSITTSGAVGTTGGGGAGIAAGHDGLGSLSINAATVTSAGGQAINAAINNVNSTGALNIEATGAIDGFNGGIQATHAGDGPVTIKSASIFSNNAGGIYAQLSNANATSGLTITATDRVAARNTAIQAVQDGEGGLTINATEAVSAFGAGIHALNRSLTGMGAMTVTATGHVYNAGGSPAIFVQNYSLGSVTVNAASTTGQIGVAAVSYNSNNDSALSITTSGTATGSLFGVAVGHNGTGSVTIHAESASGTTNDGISGIIASSGSSADMAITVTGTVTGGRDGISADNKGSGAVRLTVASGASVSGTANAINTSAGAVTSTDYVTNAGTISSSIDLGGGTNQLTNQAGGVINGNLTTGAGNDTFANDGTFTGTANLGGGMNVVTNTSHTTFNGALITGAEDDTITNTGTWTGTVDLGAGTNAFNNNAGGIFSGSTVSVGAGSVFTNAGTVSPGGAGSFATMALTGNFVQTADGVLAVDINPQTATGDLLAISGTAALAGSVLPSFNPGVTTAGQVTLLTAAGGVTNNGLSVTKSPAVGVTFVTPDANTLALQYALDFGGEGPGRTQNQRSLGNNFNQIFAAGGGDLSAILTGLLGITGETTYQKALDQLMGEHQQNQAATLFGANRTFVNNLLSCPERLDGNEKAMADEACVWSRVEGRTTDVDRSSNTVGGDETVWGFSGGYETAIPNEAQVRVGAMLSVEDIQSDSNSGASSDGTRYRVGVKAEKGFGDLELSAGLFGGITNYDTNRPTFGGGGVATSDHDISFASMVGRVSYSWDAGPVRIVPMLDVIATHLDFEEVNEAGAGAANLRIEGNEEWIYSATPALGVVGTVAETKDVKVHASLKGGVSFYSKSELTFRSNFIAAPAGVGGFTTTSGFDDVVGNVSGALQFELNEGLSIKAGYDGRFGDLSTSHGGYLRAAMPF